MNLRIEKEDEFAESVSKEFGAKMLLNFLTWMQKV